MQEISSDAYVHTYKSKHTGSSMWRMRTYTVVIIVRLLLVLHIISFAAFEGGIWWFFFFVFFFFDFFWGVVYLFPCFYLRNIQYFTPRRKSLFLDGSSKKVDPELPSHCTFNLWLFNSGKLSKNFPWVGH